MKKYFLIAVLILAFSPAYATDADTVYTVDIETWVQDLLGGTGSSSIWTSTIIRSQINLNCREYATLIGIPAQDTILSIAGTTGYSLDSNFLSVRGVVRLSEGRKKMMRQKGIGEMAPSIKGLGEENLADNPRYYAVTGGKIQRLIIDPAGGDSTDTLIVTYNAYATELDTADSVTNIPYSGIAVVVYGTYLNMLMMNREQTGVQFMIPFVEKKYQTLFNAVRAQEQSSSDYNPKAQATQ